MAFNFEIDREATLPTEEFISGYLRRNKPVVLTNTPEWRHVNLNWTPDSFAERFGKRKIILRSGGKPYQSTLRDYLRYSGELQTIQSGPPREVLYMHSILIGRVFPELLDDFEVPEYFQPNWLQRWPLNSFLSDNFCHEAKSSAVLFIGPPGANIGLVHHDRYMTHAWLHQVYGVKRLWIAGPDQTPFLYPKPGRPNESSVPNMIEPDFLTYPLLSQASVTVVDLQPGETLFLPSGWWHYASCLTLSISVSGNFVNSSNFARFAADVPPDKLAGLPLLKGTQKWLVMKAHGLICSILDMIS
jgi:hypothetical protein